MVYTHIYVYIYVCMCVCVFVSLCLLHPKVILLDIPGSQKDGLALATRDPIPSVSSSQVWGIH